MRPLPALRFLARRGGWQQARALGFASQGSGDEKGYDCSAAVLGLGLGAAAGVWLTQRRSERLHAAEPAKGLREPPARPDLPTFRLDEVAGHATAASGVWVHFRGAVYDISDFLEAHPGGVEKISLAAGASVEPFWAIYTQHESPMVQDILEGMRIGTLHPDDVEALKAEAPVDASDPYAWDPRRHPALLVNAAKPFNAETPPALLRDAFETPNDLFYVRNHLPVPKIDEEAYRLEICGKGLRRPISFSLPELKSNFKHYTVSSAIQCAGNRRASLNVVEPVKGLMWQSTAIGNASWTGVRLKDVLEAAGVDPEAAHVWMEGLDTDPLQGHHYETSVPMRKALSPETLLAFEMNGAPLPLDHGFPLRAVVPGNVGARQVKWLSKITISDEESSSHWQAVDYRMFGPSARAESVDFASAPAIQEAPVQSAILSPPPNAAVLKESGEIELSGYAWSGGGRGIVRVELSADGGRSWAPATLRQAPGQSLDRMWAWTLWTATLPLPPETTVGSTVEVLCKATDSSYNCQPDTAKGIWNFRGLLNNAWHRLPLKIE